MRFRFRRGRVTVDDGQSAGAACLVEFGDGVTVIAAWDHAGDAIQLMPPIAQQKATGALAEGGGSLKAMTVHGGPSVSGDARRQKVTKQFPLFFTAPHRLDSGWSPLATVAEVHPPASSSQIHALQSCGRSTTTCRSWMGSTSGPGAVVNIANEGGSLRLPLTPDAGDRRDRRPPQRKSMLGLWICLAGEFEER